MFVTLRRRLASPLGTMIGASVPVIALVAVLVAGDRQAPRHSAWRDPISWFAADEAPQTALTRAALLGVAAALLVVALRWRRDRGPAVFVGMLGGLLVALTLIPLECAPRIGFCQALMTHDMVGWQHLTHAGLAGVGVVMVIAGAAWAARRRRDRATVVAFVVCLGTGLAMMLDPAGGRVGALQWVFLAAAVVAIGRLVPPGDADAGVRRSSAAP